MQSIKWILPVFMVSVFSGVNLDLMDWLFLYNFTLIGDFVRYVGCAFIFGPFHLERDLEDLEFYDDLESYY